MLNGHDHLYARYRPLDPSGNYDPNKGIREFIVGTGGETLDPVVTTDTTTADPSGNPNFNAENLEAGTGEFWGVMGLTLDRNGYAWDFESALKDPAQTTGRPLTATRASVPATVQTTGSDRIVFASLGLTLLQYPFPLCEKSRRGSSLARRSVPAPAFPHPSICAQDIGRTDRFEFCGGNRQGFRATGFQAGSAGGEYRMSRSAGFGR